MTSLEKQIVERVQRSEHSAAGSKVALVTQVAERALEQLASHQTSVNEREQEHTELEGRLLQAQAECEELRGWVHEKADSMRVELEGLVEDAMARAREECSVLRSALDAADARAIEAEERTQLAEGRAHEAEARIMQLETCSEASTHEREQGEHAETLGEAQHEDCLLYTSPSPRDRTRSRMPSSA
eukprot:TRINITY_DN41563_c0_g1_i1.p1 TRINITY_DN41563_c0_g1~~TRINITY_DN41563_c0_g1_i1.p1  ORF type:complete len:186 (-),score=47.60 TRINITY_DN41563_c0_g1_i1:41-598(-)